MVPALVPVDVLRKVRANLVLQQLRVKRPHRVDVKAARFQHPEKGARPKRIPCERFHQTRADGVINRPCRHYLSVGVMFQHAEVARPPRLFLSQCQHEPFQPAVVLL